MRSSSGRHASTGGAPAPRRPAARTTVRRRLADHQLETMPVRVLEIDAAIFPGAAGHGHSVILQIGFERLVGAGRDVQGEVVEVVAGRQRRLALLLEQGHPLLASVQEDLPVVLAVDLHAQDLGVELPGALDVRDVEHEMVDPGGLNHRSALLGSPDLPSPGYTRLAGHSLHANVRLLTPGDRGAISSTARRST